MTTSTCTDRDPPHHHKSQVHHEGIHDINLLSKDIGSCSMRYNPRIMMSVISIFEEFEFFSFKTTFDYIMFSWKLCSFPCFMLVVDIFP
jgi:hypothetical protein